MSRSSTAKPTRTARLLRHVYRYALVLVLACAAIIAVIFLQLDRSVPVKDKLTQIGSGLAASIIFAIIYTVLANREFAELIREEINGQLSDHVTEIKREMNQLSQGFLPTDQFTNRDTDDHLIDYLDSLGFTEIRTVGLSAQRQAYQEFIAPFSDNLKKIGVSG
jgi:hypothetical protein